MAEPRKVQFVTLSAFAGGSASDSRKRRLDDEADINLDEDAEADTIATGAGDGGLFGKAGDRDKAEAKKITVRLNLSLSEPSDQSSAEFNYSELIQNLQAKKTPPSIAPAPVPAPVLDPNDPFNDDEKDRLQVEAMAKKFENKYGNAGKKKRKDRMQDLIDIGFGYDETDPFIDNSEAYDELVPASLTTKLGGFYINTGTLQFRATSEDEGEDGAKEGEPRQKLKDGEEQVIKRRKRKEGNSLEEKKPRKNRVPKQGVSSHNIHRPEKKKRKKLMKDSLCLAAMLRRFTREKEELRKVNPSAVHPGLAGGLANTPRANNMLANSHMHGNAANNDVSLADLTSDPAMMSLLGSANEKELQDLLGDFSLGGLDFSLLESSAPHSSARENGLLGVGVPGPKVGGGGLGRGLGASAGLLSPPPLPDGLPPPLTKRIEDLRAASRQFDQEGRKKFFTLDMNNILLDIELQVQEQPVAVRSQVYSHMEAFVPCNKEALLKRLKKLSLNIQDDRLRTPLLKLKLAVCSVMPEQIQKYNMDCMAKAAKQQSEEVEKNGSGEEEDEEKPGKRVMGPRKKFVWDDKLRGLLCNLVRVKLSCYELEAQCSLSVEDYLKAFMENEVKPLWPKGWMQARMLFKESRAVHSHLTGNLAKKRMVPGPKAKAKEGPWIQRLPTTTPPSLPSSMALAGARLPLSSSPACPSEPICLSDSLDEDLTAPSLDSISHALALLSNAAKGLGPGDSPLSPPPLQVPASSPPSVAPHYPSAQHSLSKMETPPLVAMSLANSVSSSMVAMTTASTSPSVSSMARLQAGQALTVRGGDAYGLMKGVGLMGQAQRHVGAATASHRTGVLAGGSKLHPPPSPSPPKPRPPPTASPLLPPHQKGFASPGAGKASSGMAVSGLAKSGTKAGGAGSSNGGHMGALPQSSSPSPQSRANSHPGAQSFCPPSSSSPSSSPASSSSSHPQAKGLPSHAHHHPHHQSNFITPMQATLTKSSHSSSSPIIKLTPRPPAPTPPPSSSPSPPSSSPSHGLSLPQMMAGQHQYQSPKASGFRPPFSVQGGGQAKAGGGGIYSFAGGQKAPSVSSGGANASSSPMGMSPAGSPSPSGSHGQQRQRAAGGAGQGSKSVGSRALTGTLATPPVTSHLSQVSSAGGTLLGSPPSLPLGFGMLGGLVPVSLPFQFPSLLNFSPPGVPGASGANSGYALAQSELMELYKSLQSGSQPALPPHLQLAFSDANQSQGGDMKRKSH
ncbi:ubinuclein-2a isoform X1 [Osmerus eperlanus]|uniref:ubinuclein-2a isoform X1 n=1 Tax=Osmerus eperlanus TaxID=29151 RepID=UPI002E0F8745